MNTSLGFHTFTIYMKLTVEELDQVYQAFSDCKETYFVNNDKDRNGPIIKDNGFAFDVVAYCYFNHQIFLLKIDLGPP